MSATGGSATVAPLPGLAESVDVPLAGLTTLRVGGPARRLVTATTTHDVIDAVSACDRRGEPVLVLAGGSNLLVGDAGFDGTVVRIASRGVTEDDASAWAGVTPRVGAGGSAPRPPARASPGGPGGGSRGTTSSPLPSSAGWPGSRRSPGSPG